MYKVLIIDDEPWSIEVVKALGQWDSLKLEVIGEGEDGTQGLKLMVELKPDIVVTDMRMPGIEGVELLKAINEKFPNSKIIVMSGYDDFVYLKQAIRSRAVEYLLKPIDPEELNASLAKCIEELDQAREKVNILCGASPLFSDGEVMDRYLALRQLVYGHLLELNKLSVIGSLENLKLFLENLSEEINNKNVLARIGQDYVIMLKDFMADNNSGFEKIWNEKNSEWAAANGWGTTAELIADICWLYEKAIDHMEHRLRNKKRLDLGVVMTYMDHHYQEPITLDNIAQKFYVSKEYLSRAFKTYSGENISDYILRKRMEKARELISEQNIAIKHVAQMMGYDDIAYFYRVFKKHFGFPPGELRSEN